MKKKKGGNNEQLFVERHGPSHRSKINATIIKTL